MQPNTKMSSCQATFDLKAAREICSRIKGYEDPDGGNFADFQAAEMLPVALGEIERLRAREKEFVLASSKKTHFALDTAKFWIDQYERQAKRIAELEADLEYYKSGFHSERGVHERVAAILGTDDAPWMLAQRAIERIAKLEILLGVARKDEEWVANKFGAKIDKQRAALKKLGQAKRERGKALVEERSRGNHYGMSYEDASDGEIERWIIDGEIDAPKVYIERMRMESRAQLRREGKL